VEQDDVMPSAFSGVRILDFTQVVAGPFATTLLSDMGAEVIKVERPGSREAGIPKASFEAINRGKRSITLNLDSEEAREVVRRLVPTCDVVAENFRPGAIERMGFGYADLEKLRPGIILASGSGWGREGPWALRGGYDHVAQALSGVMSEQGESRLEPHAMIAGAGDRLGGMMLAFGIASALFVRERTGQGQHIDVSLLGSLIQMQNQEVATYLESGEQHGFQRFRSATYTHYECADGEYIAIAANTQAMWERFCDAVQRPDLRDDPRFNTAEGRRQNMDVLFADLCVLFASRPQREWIPRLESADVPHAPVLDYAGVVAHPQFHANEYIVEVAQEGRGAKRMPGPPVHMSLTPPRVQGWAPMIGEHTDEILRLAGYDDREIAALHERGAV